MVNVSGGNIRLDPCEGIPVRDTIEVSRKWGVSSRGLYLPPGFRKRQRLKDWIIGEGDIRQRTVHDKWDRLEVTPQLIGKETDRSACGKLLRVLRNPRSKLLERLESSFQHTDRVSRQPSLPSAVPCPPAFQDGRPHSGRAAQYFMQKAIQHPGLGT